MTVVTAPYALVMFVAALPDWLPLVAELITLVVYPCLLTTVAEDVAAITPAVF